MQSAVIPGLLDHPDRDVIVALGAYHSGAMRAISSRDLGDLLYRAYECDASPRELKASVRRLRRAGYKIGSTRGSKVTPPGYYMIETADELAATVRPLFRQAIDQLRTIEALTGKDYFARELAGQMKLFDVQKEPEEVVAAR